MINIKGESIQKAYQPAQGCKSCYDCKESPVTASISQNKQFLKIHLLTLGQLQFIKEYNFKLLTPCLDFDIAVSQKGSFILMTLVNQKTNNYYMINTKTNQQRFLCERKKQSKLRFINDLIIESQEQLIILQHQIKFLLKEDSKEKEQYFPTYNQYQFIRKVENNLYLINLKEKNSQKKVEIPNLTTIFTLQNHMFYQVTNQQSSKLYWTNLNNFFIEQQDILLPPDRQEVKDLFVAKDERFLYTLRSASLTIYRYSLIPPQNIHEARFKIKNLVKMLQLDDRIYLFSDQNVIYVIFNEKKDNQKEKEGNSTPFQANQIILSEDHQSPTEKVIGTINSMTQSDLFLSAQGTFKGNIVHQSYRFIIKNQGENPFSFFNIDGFRLPIRQRQLESQKYIPQSNEIVLTQSYKKSLQLLIFAINQKRPIIIEGDPGIGKTQAIIFLANKTNTPLLRINMNKFIVSQDLQKKLKFERGKFMVQNSQITEAAQKGYWVLIDEANLCSYETIKIIQNLLEFSKLTVVNGTLNGQMNGVYGQQVVATHPDFRVILTQNTSVKSHSSSRIQFPQSFLSHFACFVFHHLSDHQLQELVFQKLKQSQNLAKIDLRVLSKELISIFKLIKQLQLQQKNNHNNFTLRQLLQVAEILKTRLNGVKDLPYFEFISLCFTQTLNLPQNKKSIVDSIMKNQSLLIEICNQKNEFDTTFALKLLKNELTFLTENSKLQLKFLCCNYYNRHPALIYGLPGTGKLTSIKAFCKFSGILQKDIVVIKLNQNTTYGDLFGKIYLSLESQSSQALVFKMGPITKALKNGSLIIIQGLDQVQDSISQSLNGILQMGTARQIKVNNELIEISPKTMIIATASQSSLNSCTHMSPALISRFMSFRHYELINQLEIKQQISRYFSKQLARQIIISAQKYLKRSDNNEYQSNKIYRCLFILQKFDDMLKKQNKTRQEIFVAIKDNLSLLLMLAFQQKISIQKIDYHKIPIDVASLFSKSHKLTLAETRKTLISLIYLLVKMRVMPVLEGKSGSGKTKCIEYLSNVKPYNTKTKGIATVSINQDINPQSLIGELKIQAGKIVMGKDGPLKQSLQKGSILLLDGLNLAPSQILHTVQSLCDCPNTFTNQLSGEQMNVHQDFFMVGIQNAEDEFINLNLPTFLLKKIVIIQVPDYTSSQIIEILKGQISIQGLSSQQQATISSCIANSYPYKTQNSDNFDQFQDKSQAKANARKVSLRTYMKLAKRVLKTYKANKNSIKNIKNYIQIHAHILEPTLIQRKQSFQTKLMLQKSKWIISLSSKMQSLIIQDESKLKNENQMKDIVAGLSKDDHMTLIRIILAFYFNQPSMIYGQNTKTKVIQLACKIFNFSRENPLTNIYVSQSTNISALLGGIQPHSSQTYKNYLESTFFKYLFQDQNILKPTVIAQNKNLSTFSNKIQLIQKQEVITKEQIQQMKANLQSKNQIFAKCERNLMLSIRYGGLAYLKHINQADQSVIQILNSFLEGQSTFALNNDNIQIHPLFRFICSSNSNKECSFALKSKLTIIEVASQDLNMYIEKSIKLRDFGEEKKLILDFWNVLRIHFSHIIKKITTKQINKWLDYKSVKLDQGRLRQVLAYGKDISQSIDQHPQ